MRSKKQHFKGEIDAAKRLFETELFDVLRKPGEAQAAGRPMSNIISEFPRMLRVEANSCIETGFNRFVTVAQKFQAEIKDSPVKWARKSSVEVIKKCTQGLYTSELVSALLPPEKLVSQVNRVADNATLETTILGKTKMSSTTSKRAVEKIESYVKKNGMSWAQFSIKAQIHERTLRNFRKGANVRPDTYENIAKAMNITKEQLLNSD